MKTSYIAALTVACSLGFSTTQAAIIDATDNSYLTDTVSNLDWLDLTTSVGQSYFYVSGQFGVGGEYEGWRYATGTEFNMLVSNYTGNAYDANDYGSVTQETGPIAALVALLGSTYDAHYIATYGSTWDELHGYAEGEGVDATHGLLADAVSLTTQFSALLQSDMRSPFNAAYSKAHYSRVNYGSGVSYIGSFLVRDTPSAVPIPAAAFMFVPALLGFMGLRRRAKNSDYTLSKV